MVNIRTLNPIARAVGVIGAVSVLAVSVTFAALTSNTVVLADSQFETGTAHLRIWDANLAAYTDGPVSGFDYTGVNKIVLNTETAPFTFWLQNNGDVPLTISSVSDNAAVHNNVDATQVTVKIRNVTQSQTSSYWLSDLWDTTPEALPGSALAAGTDNQYNITVTVPAAAVSGSSANLDNLNLKFTGSNP